MARRNPFERLPQAVAEAVVQRIVEVIDVDAIVRKVDVDDIVKRVDVNAIVDRVDVERIVERVDVDQIVERVDVDKLMARVDLDALMARVDVDAIVDRLDIDQILERTEFSSIVAKSTSGALSEFLDLLRRQVVSVDVIVDRLVGRSRTMKDKPLGPRALESERARDVDARAGEYAGAVSRLLAIAADSFIAWALFLLGVGAIEASLSLFMSHPPTLFHRSWLAIPFVAIWYFIYFAWQWSLGGRTVGMALLGIRVVTIDGDAIGQRAAAIRILVLPFSIFVLALGLIGVVFKETRQGWHDRAASTTVVYSWNARSAKMGWLSKKPAKTV